MFRTRRWLFLCMRYKRTANPTLTNFVHCSENRGYLQRVSAFSWEILKCFLIHVVAFSQPVIKSNIKNYHSVQWLYFIVVFFFVFFSLGSFRNCNNSRVNVLLNSKTRSNNYTTWSPQPNKNRGKITFILNSQASIHMKNCINCIVIPSGIANLVRPTNIVGKKKKKSNKKKIIKKLTSGKPTGVETYDMQLVLLT